MSGHREQRVTGADIRDKLNHPVVDADGHMIETTFAVLDFVKQVGGPEIAARYENIMRSDAAGRTRNAVWVGNSGPASIDRATAMLPRLLRVRLDEAGIDFSVVYGTHALAVLRLEDDALRPVVYRAMNMLYADMFKDVSDRLTPVALIPMHSPQEALSELDFAIRELGLKAIVMNVVVRRPAPEVVKEAPHLAAYSMAPTSPGIDVGDDYDPVWAKCVELGVAPSCHNAVRGRGTTHGSHSNYVFNSLGSFAQGSDYFCRALFFGGVPQRFPTLKFPLYFPQPPFPRASPQGTLEASASPILRSMSRPRFVARRLAVARCRCVLGPQLSPRARGRRRVAGWRRENAVVE